MLVPYVAKARILEYILNRQTPDDLVVCLFINDCIPAVTDSIASYKEAYTGGYERMKLGANDWLVTVQVDAEVCAQHPKVTWTFTGHVGPVYGYYVSTTSGTLMSVERFTDGPYLVKWPGDQITITPEITLK